MNLLVLIFIDSHALKIDTTQETYFLNITQNYKITFIDFECILLCF